MWPRTTGARPRTDPGRSGWRHVGRRRPPGDMSLRAGPTPKNEKGTFNFTEKLNVPNGTKLRRNSLLKIDLWLVLDHHPETRLHMRIPTHRIESREF